MKIYKILTGFIFLAFNLLILSSGNPIQVDQKELYREIETLIKNMNQYYDKFNSIIIALNQGKIDNKTLIKDASATQIKEKINEIYQLDTNYFSDIQKITKLISMISDLRIEPILQNSIFRIMNNLEKYIKEFPNLIRDPNERHANQFTALHIAATNGDLEAVKELLKLGADVNAFGVNNITPLMQAAYFDHDEVVKLLLINGADTGQLLLVQEKQL